jgi:hypothetical protein
MFMTPLTTNYVTLAVKRAGGPTAVANALEVSGTTIHEWKKKERVSRLRYAEQLSKLSGIKVEYLYPIDESYGIF